MSQRGWVLFLFGCTVILVLEGPDTLRWLGGGPAGLVQAAESAQRALEGSRDELIRTREPAAAELAPEPPPAVPWAALARPAVRARWSAPDLASASDDFGIEPARVAAAPRESTAEVAPPGRSAPFRISGGCMPVPAARTRPVTP